VATSRTGTALWKKLSAAAKWQAQQNGQDQCPHCHVILDYVTPKQPNSAEADHIVPHSLGGTDTMDNIEVICRHCNGSKGKRSKPRSIRHAAPIRNTGRWG